MFDNQAAALAEITSIRPRGLRPGDSVSYQKIGAAGPVTFTVAGLQQWQIKGASHPVGLIWTGNCASCGATWYQVTETHVRCLSEVCPDCDVIGIAGPQRDEALCKHLLTKQAEAASPRAMSVKRVGRIEAHVLSLVDKSPQGISLEDLTAQTVATLPTPKPDIRDTRKQWVARAIRSLTRDPHGLLQIADGLIRRR